MEPSLGSIEPSRSGFSGTQPLDSGEPSKWVPSNPANGFHQTQICWVRWNSGWVPSNPANWVR
ncbi:hypothetical protein SLEP1_g51981 [Rubroshorea leprosula]|uniref:Chitin-binding type-3 domain-containing protein n=1 Tax=Rubroshorea leprosula TaxID=152421 RepID=A0AAV5M5R3_9ROSI|nr:hypothetical protein SLEP1_g51981 [Rubroshorea leprosula]